MEPSHEGEVAGSGQTTSRKIECAGGHLASGATRNDGWTGRQADSEGGLGGDSSRNVGSDGVLKGKVQQLKKEFEIISFLIGESVDDFALRLTNLITRLATLGAPIDETQVIEKLSRVVSPRLS
jgi:hypothetical protein